MDARLPAPASARDESDREIPFPVRTPYRIRADVRPMLRCGASEQLHFDRDADAPVYRDAKRAVFEANGSAGVAQWAGVVDPIGCTYALMATIRRLSTEAPNVAQVVDEDGGRTARVSLVPIGVALVVDTTRGEVTRINALDGAGDLWCSWLRARPATDRLADALALTVQEDFVVMAFDAARGQAIAELIHVALPSGWAPEAKRGRSFMDIHGPVPENGSLVAADVGLMRVLTNSGPYLRYVWGLHATGALDQHPDRGAHTARAEGLDGDSYATPGRVDQLWFRSERQTTIGVPSVSRFVFTIRVYARPLVEVVRDPDKAARLAESIRSMSPAVRTYKGLDPWFETILPWLDAAARRA